eukprot:4262433-Amphidinium_carterae.1
MLLLRHSREEVSLLCTGFDCIGFCISSLISFVPPFVLRCCAQVTPLSVDPNHDGPMIETAITDVYCFITVLLVVTSKHVHSSSPFARKWR